MRRRESLERTKKSGGDIIEQERREVWEGKRRRRKRRRVGSGCKTPPSIFNTVEPLQMMGER